MPWLKKAVSKRPDITPEELRRMCAKPCGMCTRFRALQQLRASYNKTLTAAEQNRPDVVAAREAWVRIAELTETSRFIFIDESGAKTTMMRQYGRAFDGARVYDRVPHGHWCTTTMVAAVGFRGAVAPCAFDGAMDTQVFRAYAEHVLVPELRAGDIVVLDNLSCHADRHARGLIELTGAQVWFLPA